MAISVTIVTKLETYFLVFNVVIVGIPPVITVMKH